MTREELAKQSPELVDALLAEGKLKAEAENRTANEKAAADATAAVLAVVKAVAGEGMASSIETTLNVFKATSMTPEQIAVVAPLVAKADAPAPAVRADAESASRSQILSALQGVHEAPANAAPGTAPEGKAKGALLADAERRTASK